jgi:hypothetical protein
VHHAGFTIVILHYTDTATGGIFVKFDIEDFLWKFVVKFQFWFKAGTSREDLSGIIFVAGDIKTP